MSAWRPRRGALVFSLVWGVNDIGTISAAVGSEVLPLAGCVGPDALSSCLCERTDAHLRGLTRVSSPSEME